MADAANAIYTLKQVGIDATAHEPRDVRTFDLGAFDTIISMDNHVGRALNALFPHLPANLLLKWRVNDPYGDDLPEYRHCAELIHKEIKRFVAVLDRKEMGPNNAFHSDGSRAARENRR